jgi:hypothetical protein
MDPSKQTYLADYKEGFLWKKGKDDNKFLSRKFVLSEAENTLKYFRKEDVRIDLLFSTLLYQLARIIVIHIGNSNIGYVYTIIGVDC